MKKVIEKYKQIRLLFLQWVADLIIELMYESKKDADFMMYYTWGMSLDTWCMRRGIELE